jgi:hypothetical protein
MTNGRNAMRKIRTTMQPTVEIEVSEKEYTDLLRQGLVHDETTTDTATGATDSDPDRELTPDALAEAGKSLELDKDVETSTTPELDTDAPGNYGSGQPRTRTAKQDKRN